MRHTTWCFEGGCLVLREITFLRLLPPNSQARLPAGASAVYGRLTCGHWKSFITRLTNHA